MSNTLRGAVIGCGYFAQNHLHGWQEIDGVEIVAVCDIDEVKARQSAQKFGIPSAFTDAEQLLQQSVALDFVDIVTTPESHHALVELSARYVKHTMCQKPVAPSLADARAMVAACEKAGVQFMVFENFRWQTPMLRLKSYLASIGDVFFGRVYFRSGYDVYANQPYLAEAERFILYDLGIHLFDLVRFFMGEAECLTCLTQRVNPKIKGEDVATALMKMRSGATCIVDLSYASQCEVESFPQTLVYLEGTQGSISLNHDYRLTVVRGKQETYEVVAPAIYPWSHPPHEAVQESVVNIQRHWVDCLRHNREPDTSGSDNLKTLELVFGAYESAATGLPYRVGTGLAV
jgi:predicted dehydrogenase